MTSRLTGRPIEPGEGQTPRPKRANRSRPVSARETAKSAAHPPRSTRRYLVFGINLRPRALKRGQIAVVLILIILPLLSLIGLAAELGLRYIHWGIVQQAGEADVRG